MMDMLKSFFSKKNIKENEKEESNKEILSKENREVKGLCFVQSHDESIVIEFLNNMDKEFESSKVGWKEQGEYFENFLAAVFRLAGYEVKITEKSYIKDNKKFTGDHGFDLELWKGEEHIAVQAKHYRLNTKAPKLITKDYVTNFSGISDKDWTKKLFITTSLFNPHVYAEIEENEKTRNIEWYDRYGLLQLLNSIIPDTMEKFIFLTSLPKKVTKCPKCESGFLVQKWSDRNHSYFKGCTMFPECKYTEKIGR